MGELHGPRDQWWRQKVCRAFFRDVVRTIIKLGISEVELYTYANSSSSSAGVSTHTYHYVAPPRRSSYDQSWKRYFQVAINPVSTALYRVPKLTLVPNVQSPQGEFRLKLFQRSRGSIRKKQKCIPSAIETPRGAQRRDNCRGRPRNAGRYLQESTNIYFMYDRCMRKVVSLMFNRPPFYPTSADYPFPHLQ